MNEITVYLSAAIFLIFIFPLHVYNYVYIDTDKKYASVNAGFYGIINFFNRNTAKSEINGKKKDKKEKSVSLRKLYKIFDRLCIFKIIQLADFGARSEVNAYIMLAHNALTTAIYKFVQTNGNYCKLRNYAVLNEEHSYIRYYAKVVTVVNLLVILKIYLILLMEKIHEKQK